MEGLNIDKMHLADNYDDRFTYVAACAIPGSVKWKAVISGNPHDHSTDLRVETILSVQKNPIETAWGNNDKIEDSYRIEFASGFFITVPGYWMVPILK